MKKELLEKLEQIGVTDQVLHIGGFILVAVMACIGLYMLREMWINYAGAIHHRENPVFKDKYGGR